ncbi:hypothetical protein PybrP1_001830 [[Pythium] brassicae (nom. inval.)]|nr:hypothetical protein PybrP1_001830 [[Pythium] brassicae (nom. inval.)]
MAKPFKSFGNEMPTASWADDDEDIDVPLPIAPLKLPELAHCKCARVYSSSSGTDREPGLTGCALGAGARMRGRVAEKDQPEEEAPARRDFNHRDSAFCAASTCADERIVAPAD